MDISILSLPVDYLFLQFLTISVISLSAASFKDIVLELLFLNSALHLNFRGFLCLLLF